MAISLCLAASFIGVTSVEATFLADVIEKRQFEQVAPLLATGEDVNAAQVDGMTPLHWAAFHDQADIVRTLLAKGANASAVNRYGIHPLYLACLNGNAAMVKALLQAGADPSVAVLEGELPLMTASRTGDVESVDCLLSAGADVNGEGRDGQTAAMWAAAEGHVDVMERLFAADADLGRRLPSSGYSAFFFAVREGQAPVVRFLLDKGQDVNEAMKPANAGGKRPMKNTSALILAIENGHFDLAVELLRRGADPNDERTGYTPLHTLTWIRKPDIGESSAGAPKPQGSGRRNSVQFIRELVKAGADVNKRLERGRKAGGAHYSRIGATPFLLAADRADLPYMKLLVELGADPMLPNVDGTTPLMVAAGIGSSAPEEEAGNEEECLAAVQYLVSLGADLNTVDASGETAMHGAAYKNIPAVVYYLAEAGADITIWNQDNKAERTPLLIAEGYRPGNFKPSFETVEAITKVMLAAGVKPPSGPKPHHTNYAN